MESTYGVIQYRQHKASGKHHASVWFCQVSGVKEEEDGAQHRALRNSTRQRSVFGKWLVYCDMLGSVSQVWTKTTDEQYWKCPPHRTVASGDFHGQWCLMQHWWGSREREAPSHQHICTAQDVINDTKYGRLTAVSWAVCWLKLVEEVMLV